MLNKTLPALHKAICTPASTKTANTSNTTNVYSSINNKEKQRFRTFAPIA